MAAAAPRRIEIVPWGQPKSNVGNFARTQDSASLGGGYNSNATGVLNDQYVWDVLLDSGTWAIDLIYRSGPARAIATIYLDSTSVGSVDMYAASNTSNVVATVSGISVASVGNYSLKLKAESKNASSTAYNMTFHLIILRRTGA